jgi:NADH:ubiquinone oxidoreductase subunit E
MSEALRSLSHMKTVAVGECTVCGGDALVAVVEIEVDDESVAAGELDAFALTELECLGACAGVVLRHAA